MTAGDKPTKRRKISQTDKQVQDQVAAAFEKANEKTGFFKRWTVADYEGKVSEL